MAAGDKPAGANLVAPLLCAPTVAFSQTVQTLRASPINAARSLLHPESKLSPGPLTRRSSTVLMRQAQEVHGLELWHFFQSHFTFRRASQSLSFTNGSTGNCVVFRCVSSFSLSNTVPRFFSSPYDALKRATTLVALCLSRQ